jgi:hypothetical protein
MKINKINKFVWNYKDDSFCFLYEEKDTVGNEEGIDMKRKQYWNNQY